LHSSIQFVLQGMSQPNFLSMIFLARNIIILPLELSDHHHNKFI